MIEWHKVWEKYVVAPVWIIGIAVFVLNMLGILPYMK